MSAAMIAMRLPASVLFAMSSSSVWTQPSAYRTFGDAKPGNDPDNERLAHGSDRGARRILWSASGVEERRRRSDPRRRGLRSSDERCTAQRAARVLPARPHGSYER